MEVPVSENLRPQSHDCGPPTQPGCGAVNYSHARASASLHSVSEKIRKWYPPTSQKKQLPIPNPCVHLSGTAGLSVMHSMANENSATGFPTQASPPSPDTLPASPLQCLPSPVQPDLQMHLYDRGVFWQIASMWQLSVPSTHSSTSGRRMDT